MKSIWIILSCTLLLPSAPSWAGIGTITEQLHAPPSIQRQKTTVDGKKGTAIQMNDAVRTAAGKVGITFQDNTRVQVNENSRLVIDDFVYDPKKGTGKVALNMAMGTVRYASGQIAKNNPQQVAINTPTATVSVRGTDFTATVDEIGASTFILLPSCRDDRPTRTRRDIEANCVIGEIVVTSDAGQVILNQPFQATRVTQRSLAPLRPVVLSLSEEAISNLLILAPPKEIQQAAAETRSSNNLLDRDFLKFDGLDNALEVQMLQMFQDRLSRNFLDNNYLAGIFDMIGNSLDENFLEEVDQMLPDYKKASGIVVTKDDPVVTLCRDNGSDVQCVTTPQTQNSLLIQVQNNIEFKNRVNQGGNTTITLIQR